MMFQNPKKIQVLNVPKDIPVERLVNKLTIHFQKPSNGGGEVLDVDYPTTVKQCAYIIFEKEEDANSVLKREHVLKLDEKKYKLEVREADEGHINADNEEVMLFVITKLDISHFPHRKARQLIFRHDFQIVSYKAFIVEIKGSFSSLKKLRSDLMSLIPHQLPHAVTDLRHSANRKRLDRDKESVQSDLAFTNYRQQRASSSSSNSSTTSEEDDYRAGQYASNVQSRSSVRRVHSDKSNSSPLVSSPSSLPVTSSKNIEDTSPNNHRSIRGLQGAVGFSSTSEQRKGGFSKMDNRSLNAYSSHSSTSSSHPSLSITVDTLVFEYVEAFGMNEFHQLLEEYSTEIEKCYIGELCEIFLYPKEAEVRCRRSLSDAKSAVCAHIQNIQQQLRTHEIDLTAIKSCEREKVLCRYKSANGSLIRVLLMIKDQTIILVGPSAESYDTMQYILGKYALPSTTESRGPCQRGRRLNRSEKHAKRNSSCPPTNKQNPMDGSTAYISAIKRTNQTQAPTGDQGQILSSKPSPGCACQRRRSLSESRMTTKRQRSPVKLGVQDSQTKAGSHFEAQRTKSDKQANFPRIRQNLTPVFHKGNKRGKPGIDI
ncbi:uncharacterized protein si:dkey-154b15.1 isoform X2 [Heterodontus francisci]